MPANIIKQLADKSGESTKRVEELWDKAKSIVKKEYSDISKEDDRFYALVVGILKKMLKITEESNASMTTTSVGVAPGGSGEHKKYMGMVKRHEKKCKCKNEGEIKMKFREYLKEGIKKIKYGTGQESEIVSYKKGEKIDKKYIRHEQPHEKGKFVAIQRAPEADKHQDIYGMYFTDKNGKVIYSLGSHPNRAYFNKNVSKDVVDKWINIAKRL